MLILDWLDPIRDRLSGKWSGSSRPSLTRQDEASSAPAPEVNTDPAGEVSASSTPAAPPPTDPSANKLAPLSIRILCADVHTHLDGVHRQRGGIGSQGFDEKQSDLRKFFGGGGGDGARSAEK